MSKYILLFIFLLLSHSPIQAAENNKPSTGSGGGWRESYGGDSAVMEFKHLVKEVAYVLNEKKFQNNFGLDISTLQKTIDLSVIECKSNLTLDGFPKDAINFPNENPQKIQLDCKRWNNDISPAQKYRLAIHEYLPLSKLDDSSYEFSEEIFSFFTKNRYFSNFNIRDMVIAIVNCSVNNYRTQASLGGNIFQINERGYNLLQISVAFSCDDITQDLIDAGLEYFTNIDIGVYAHYHLLEQVFFSNSQANKNKILQELKVLTKRWPTLSALGFKSPIWLSRDTYEISSECTPGSTIMHLLASDSKNRKVDITFLKELIKIGFSIDQENICGQTPRSIFKLNGINLEGVF